MIELASDPCAVMADRIRSANREISRRWLERLKALLPVDANEIFPTDQILDHIPSLVHEIADYIAASAADSVSANTAIQSKATEMGQLRFEQQASVHQLLREYRFLGTVIADFVAEELQRLPEPMPPVDAVRLMARLNEAVFVLLQMTVDTFVGRYAERIDEQTTRLDGFNRMITHELRQPLSSVQYALELLDTPVGDAEKRLHYMEVARRNIRRVSDLIRMLGTLAKPETDNLQMQAIDLAKLVADVCRQVSEVAAEKGVALENEVESTELTIDVARLELVLVNLLSNGIKYRDPGRADAFVKVMLRRTGGALQLLVADNGLGIKPEDHSRVFRRFYRAHTDRDASLATDGLGLGLAIVAECIKAMRASITLTSAEGAGTTFVITLPTTTSGPSTGTP